MTLEITRVASESSPQLEIGEKPGDTPRSATGNRLLTRGLIFAVAATQVLSPAYAVIDEPIFTARDMTGYRDQEGSFEDVTEPPHGVPPEEEARLSAADSANRDRLELLARAYVAGQLSSEEEARLAIVSERVRRLIPRVTASYFEEIEHIVIDVQQIGSEDGEQRRRLGIT